MSEIEDVVRAGTDQRRAHQEREQRQKQNRSEREKQMEADWQRARAEIILPVFRQAAEVLAKYGHGASVHENPEAWSGVAYGEGAVLLVAPDRPGEAKPDRATALIVRLRGGNEVHFSAKGIAGVVAPGPRMADALTKSHVEEAVKTFLKYALAARVVIDLRDAR